MQIPQMMKTAAIDRFGGPDELSIHTLRIPEVGPDDVLIRIATAGVGVWDPLDREGRFAQMVGRSPAFPYVLGTDGAGTVAKVGSNVTRFREGDQVYAYGELDPRSRFYAEYAVINADKVALVPNGISVDEAGAMATDAITALCGLEELDMKSGETLLIFGASGGVGHLALQLAKRMGVRVLAVASGPDGVALARKLGADKAIDGHVDDILSPAWALAQAEGVDAALITANSDGLADALAAVHDQGRVAYPHGVQPAPHPRDGVSCKGYDGRVTRERLDRLNELIEAGPFTVHVARTYDLAHADEAHRALANHFLGKLALEVGARA